VYLGIFGRRSANWFIVRQCVVPAPLLFQIYRRELAVDDLLVPLLARDGIKMFASKIADFVSLSATERESLGQKCRQLIETRFSLEEMHRGYYAIYQQLA